MDAFSPPAAAALSASAHYANAHSNANATANARSSAGVPFFQPPKSPAVVAASPSFATATDYFHSGSRKRQRPDSSHAPGISCAPQTPWTETPSWTRCPTPSDGLYSSAFGQNSGLVNEKYRLAGGFDTPSLESTSRLEQLTVNDDEFRRRLRNADMDFPLHRGCTPLSGPLARERNGIARLSSAPGEHQTWTGMAFDLVGKVFSFGGSVFRGFYAGGGQGYEFKDSALVGSDLLQHNAHGSSTPLPGAWQNDEFLGDFEQDSPHFVQASPGRPTAKRRQTERDTWVLVGASDHDESLSSPRRKASSNSVPRSTLAQSRPGASRASSRRSLAPVSRRQTTFTGGELAAAQHTPLPPPTHSRRASIAHTRSPQGRPSSQGLSCMSPEAERYAKRQAKKDRAVDKTMTNMGNRIQEMMRQAQEALGTKYSVEGESEGMDIEDEGFVDDDW